MQPHVWLRPDAILAAMHHSHEKKTTEAKRAPELNAQSRGFLTIAEAAYELGASRRFLELEASRGRLRVLRLSPRLVRIRREDWLKYTSP